jgi:hypothetical protein
MRKKELKLNSEGDGTGKKKRLWWGLAESAFDGSLESACLFCVGVIGRSLASVAVKMFSRLIWEFYTFYLISFYKFRRPTFNAICK